MNIKKWVINGFYLVVTLIAFSLSIFKLNSPVWIAAWIAPVFLIRFMRNSKWIFAVISGYIVLQLAFFISIAPFITIMDTISIKADFSFMLMMQAKSGMLFLPLLFLVPFILDKALNNYLPKFATSLIYPSGVVAIELFNSLVFGTLNTFGESQFTLPPLVVTSSLFGFLGLSFLVAWFASMINYLWEETWNIKKCSCSVLVYIGILAVMLIYGGMVLAFPKQTEKNAFIAGITLENGFFKRMADSDLYVTEIFNLNPAEIAELMNSPQSHLHEIHQKTLEAIEAGAKVIIWQEYALSLESDCADSFLMEMKNLADQEDIYLLASYARLLNRKERDDRVMKNMSVLFTPDGEKAWEYVKAFPAPGYEELMVEAGSREIPYIDTPYGRIGQVICADMLLPHFIRQAALKNIDLLLVPSFDAPMFTPLISFSSGYRAVENGFTMVRITGDGHSAVIDPYYRHWAGQNSFEQHLKKQLDLSFANFYVNVPVVSGNTFYAGIGFIFPYIISLLLIVLIVLAVIRAVKKE